MELSEIGVVAGLVLAGFAIFYAAFILAGRRRRRRRRTMEGAAAPAMSAEAPKAARTMTPEPQQQAEAAAAARRMERRLEEIEAVQADLAERLEDTASAASSTRIEALAGSLVTLIRDKNAALETALAGLDQLRSRLQTLEQMGEPAEARALLERLTTRLDALQSDQAAARAETETRLGTLQADAGRPLSELADQLTRLYAQKDAVVETVFARLAPLETRLAEMQESAASRVLPEAALDRVVGDLETVRRDQETVREQLATLQARAESDPHTDIAERLADLHAQKDATVETVFARLAPLEARLAEIEGVAPRLAAIEAGAEARDPSAALAALGSRLDALQGAQSEAAGRLSALAAAAEDDGPVAEIAERLAALAA